VNERPKEGRGGTLVPCPSCGTDLPAGESFCPACGADLSLSSRTRRDGLGSRWLLIGAVLAIGALAVAGVARIRAVGPGPDLATTLRWILAGDGARRSTLATLARAYETSRAVMRCSLDRDEPCPLASPDWREIASYANAAWRGYVPLIQWAVPETDITGRLADLLAVDGRDGWGRPFRVDLAPWQQQSTTGFYPDAVGAGPPPPRERTLLHLTLLSAGPDGAFGTADDIRFEALFPGPGALQGNIEALKARQREIDRGRVWRRWSGTSHDLVEARTLAEWYFELRRR
jgi:hypothetical protein